MKLSNFYAGTLCLSLVAFAGCSTNRDLISENDYYPTVTNSSSLKEDEYTVVEFEQGDNTLSDAGKAKLKSFIESAQYGGRDIENIKILSWSDVDNKGGTATDFDRAIASERSEAVEEYLKDELKTGADYSNINMVERKSIQDVFKSEDWKRQPLSKAESRTLPSSDANEEMASLDKNKASKALVVVDYQ